MTYLIALVREKPALTGVAVLLVVIVALVFRHQMLEVRYQKALVEIAQLESVKSKMTSAILRMNDATLARQSAFDRAVMSAKVLGEGLAASQKRVAVLVQGTLDVQTPQTCEASIQLLRESINDLEYLP